MHSPGLKSGALTRNAERGMENRSIYRSRGRLMKNRSGSWTLAFNLVVAPGTMPSNRTGYEQFRGQRDDLIAHAEKLGIKALYLPGIIGTVPIEFAKLRLDSMEKCEAMFAQVSDVDLEAKWFETKSYVSEACEIEHLSIETELDRRTAIKQGAS